MITGDMRLVASEQQCPFLLEVRGSLASTMLRRNLGVVRLLALPLVLVGRILAYPIDCAGSGFGGSPKRKVTTPRSTTRGPQLMDS